MKREASVVASGGKRVARTEHGDVVVIVFHVNSDFFRSFITGVLCKQSVQGLMPLAERRSCRSSLQAERPKVERQTTLKCDSLNGANKTNV